MRASLTRSPSLRSSPLVDSTSPVPISDIDKYLNELHNNLLKMFQLSDLPKESGKEAERKFNVQLDDLSNLKGNILGKNLVGIPKEDLTAGRRAFSKGIESLLKAILSKKNINFKKADIKYKINTFSKGSGELFKAICYAQLANDPSNSDFVRQNCSKKICQHFKKGRDLISKSKDLFENPEWGSQFTELNQRITDLNQRIEEISKSMDTHLVAIENIQVPQERRLEPFKGSKSNKLKGRFNGIFIKENNQFLLSQNKFMRSHVGLLPNFAQEIISSLITLKIDRWPFNNKAIMWDSSEALGVIFDKKIKEVSGEFLSQLGIEELNLCEEKFKNAWKIAIDKLGANDITAVKKELVTQLENAFAELEIDPDLAGKLGLSIVESIKGEYYRLVGSSQKSNQHNQIAATKWKEALKTLHEIFQKNKKQVTRETMLSEWRKEIDIPLDEPYPKIFLYHVCLQEDIAEKAAQLDVLLKPPAVKRWFHKSKWSCLNKKWNCFCEQRTKYFLFKRVEKAKEIIDLYGKNSKEIPSDLQSFFDRNYHQFKAKFTAPQQEKDLRAEKKKFEGLVNQYYQHKSLEGHPDGATKNASKQKSICTAIKQVAKNYQPNTPADIPGLIQVSSADLEYIQKAVKEASSELKSLPKAPRSWKKTKQLLWIGGITCIAGGLIAMAALVTSLAWPAAIAACIIIIFGIWYGSRCIASNDSLGLWGRLKNFILGRISPSAD